MIHFKLTRRSSVPDIGILVMLTGFLLVVSEPLFLAAQSLPLHQSTSEKALPPSLPTLPDWTDEPDQTFAWFGYHVASAGDVNGDGFDDVIVGAPYFDQGQTDEGAAFVYLGSALGLSVAPDWMAESNQAGAFLGWIVAGAGDVNDDGYDDILVSAPRYSNGQTEEGHVFVWFGSASGLGVSGTPTNADWYAESNQDKAEFGYSATGAGDVNKDGYDDILVGAYQYEQGDMDEGAAFVWFGGASGPGASGNPANAAWFYQSNQALAALGTSVAGAGDINNDGYDDIVLGAQRYTDSHTEEGAALVFFGSNAGLSASPDWMATGGQAGACLGSKVVGAGDVNGDGFDDLLVGSAAYSDGSLLEGAAFLWLGGTDGPGATGTPANADWQVQGEQIGARLGQQVAGVGDINQDGFADVLVTASHRDNGQKDAGYAAVYFGHVTGLSGTPDWSTDLNQAYAYFGFSAAGAGDINNDGHNDLLVGAYGFENGQSDEGQVFVYQALPSEDFVVLNVKAWLQGTYASGSMSTALNQADLLPNAHPYLTPTQTSVDQIPNNEVVDWVQVGLRTGTAAATTIAQKAVFILQDGNVVDLDGISPVAMPGVVAGSYYLVLDHRTHLPVMSANPVALNSVPTAYDFTTAQSQAFGTEPMNEVETGIFALWGGDANADNKIEYIGANRDQLPIINVLGISNLAGSVVGYLQGDLNMDGKVEYIGADRDQVVIINTLGITNLAGSRASQVPH